MIIRAIARGEPDAAPLTKVFAYEDDAADEVFAASVKSVVDLLEGGRRININQALLLLAARAMELLNSGRSAEQACRDLSGMIRAEQVMIGVPEMLRTLEFEISSGGGVTNVVAYAPIAIPTRATGPDRDP